MAEGFSIMRRVRDWLRAVPVADAVDRRNAPTLQVVLLMLAGLPPLAWLHRVLFTERPWHPTETGAMLGSLGLSLLAALCVALIRRGRYQLALHLMLGAIAVLMMDAYVKQGMTANMFELPLQAAWLVVAGLMAGRRALWLLYLWLVLAFAAGSVTDFHVRPGMDTWGALASFALVMASIFLFITVVVDRGGVALRESLTAERARGDELAVAKTRLEAEMAERERLHQQLIHSQKVEAVGRLAAGVAHDFNHLLTLILGYAARGAAAEDRDQVRAALDGVESAARRASAVSRKLTSFSHRGMGLAEVFDLNAALAEMQPMLRQLFNPDVRIAFAPAPQPAQVRMDRGEFELIVLNLAANANYAMPDGGRFDIRVEPLADDRVLLSFGDTGHGMDEAVRQRLFEPFFTTRPDGQGSGLGLAVAYDVVTATGGALSVESAPGRGTTFRLELPLAGSAGEARAAAETVRAGVP
ncbi:sensor histidine kinase [Tahibacter harae]|uniref:histidine kinase n=1 Tax=Tahibacter harae TaxID=2963937 RepID=A0ABT1QST8_9GAMM|nr:ATP-binding protein [Tahibacter harae]MCQ4165355.1 ATP-binding protein [Tahibacter harae]